jgi:hypothetical protein
MAPGGHWKQYTTRNQAMKHITMLAGTTALVLGLSVVQAAEQTSQLGTGETHEQKCARWADYQGLAGDKRAEYQQDCLLDLRVPDKENGGGDD